MLRKLLEQFSTKTVSVDRELYYLETIRDLSKANLLLSEKLNILQDSRKFEYPDAKEVEDFKPLHGARTLSDLKERAERVSHEQASKKVS